MGYFASLLEYYLRSDVVIHYDPCRGMTFITTSTRILLCRKILVELTGIEPVTS